MNKENNTDEIDLIQVFGMIKNTFKNFLKLVISIVLFYKKKAILFLVLLVIGVAIGYFLDQNQNAKNNFVQEIIIEPNYNSVKYIYDFVEELEYNFRDNNFLKKLSLNQENIKNVKKISIEPIVKGTDVLDNLEKRYENREFFKDIMEAYDDGKVEEEKFRDFYKHHKVTFEFNKESKYNSKIISSVLNYIKSNKYYQDISELTLKQKKIDIERNKKSLQFIDTYLNNLEKTPLKAENEAIIFSSESEKLPMVSVASLLQKKELLIELINEQEHDLVFNKEIFSVVDYGGIISKRKELYNRMLFTIPMFLIGLVSLFYFFKHMSKSINNFVKEEEQ
ncbi:hypothetical protein [Aquimarina muelleri]|uniref:Chain length determinant protein n=1 Tax=Aquimarina muelleri TaxID=279356 RepID=A0A918N440_9FLAO|nr:hypothetical protein [Aquimarina muelleri]MCX2764204.1 hypothetical protein [Aquimarina muelleri]GGX19582.1 hypothetical protein GCM10007384_21120 [Aquimarina muelleri]